MRASKTACLHFKELGWGNITRTILHASIQKVILDKHKTFKLEKILSRKRRRQQNIVLVKCVGWPDKTTT